MDEYAARFAIGGSSGGPPRRHVSRSRVAITRRIISRVTRQDPHRNLTTNAPVFSTYGVAWDWTASEDDGSLGVIIAHLCDPGLTTIGAPREIIEAIAYAEMDDGCLWKFEQGILRDFQITVGTRAPVKFSSTWEFGKLTEAVSFPASATTEAGTYAGPITTTLTIGALSVPVFDATFAFNRDATPAGFGLDGIATSYKGAIAVDLIGRATVRLSEADAFAAISDRLEESLTLTITAGARTFAVVVPAATMQVTGRRIVSSAALDYNLEFMATKLPGQPLATLLQT